MVIWSSADDGKIPEMVMGDMVKVISVLSADEKFPSQKGPSVTQDATLLVGDSLRDNLP
jgi:hypothetical protein